MSILPILQESIETLHDISTELDVEAYLVDDKTRHEIPGARAGLPEQLFVREDDEGVEVGLYIDPKLVERLEADHPLTCLHDGNLESFCVVLEGVSHFVLLAYRARIGRPVSQLELEIQAEVDKFVTAWLLLDVQGMPRVESGSPLARRLFEAYVLRDDVPAGEAQRYHTASRVAGGYCQKLVRRFGRDRDTTRIRHDVRGFYRRGLADKLRLAA